MTSIAAHLQKGFVSVYKNCDKGKNKYLQFQLEWYAHCTSTLLAEVESNTAVILESWKVYRERSGVTVSVWNPVIVSVCACVYDYMMKAFANKTCSERNDHNQWTCWKSLKMFTTDSVGEH